MSNYIDDTKKNLLEFYEESVDFIRKCDKPDRKGSPISHRIHQNRLLLRYRLRYHGQRRIRHQAGLHPDQQDPPKLNILAVNLVKLSSSSCCRLRVDLGSANQNRLWAVVS